MAHQFRLKSHPAEGRTLFRHLKTVGNACKEKVQFIENKLLLKTDEKWSNLSDWAYIIGITHDFAKATSYFQDMLYDKNKRSVYSRHSGLSSLFTYYVCNKVFPDNTSCLSALAYIAVRRHHGDLTNVINEEADIDRFDTEIFEIQLKDLISTRANGFSALNELRMIYNNLLPQMQIDEFFNLDINSLIRKVCKELKRIVRNQDLNNYFKSLILYSALQEADKSDAGNISIPARRKEINLDMIYSYRYNEFSNRFDKISNLRELAFTEIMDLIHKIDLHTERTFSITLPTGFGKTICGLATAFFIRAKVEDKSGYSPRIIYSLPFLSIIDQNAEVIRKIILSSVADISNHHPDNNNKNYLSSHNILNAEEYSSMPTSTTTIPSNLFLVHHHLAEKSYRMSGKREDEEEAIDYKTSVFLIEGWNSELIITTFIQFFESIITNKKNMLRKFNNIAGSIIILDEIQAIPTKYWDGIDKALNFLCDKLGCWVILMTATKPSILKRSRELVEWQKYLHEDRVRYSFKRGEQSLKDVADTIFKQLRSKRKKEKNQENNGRGTRILAILNTIGESKELYEIIKNRLLQEHYEDDANNNNHSIDEDGVCHFFYNDDNKQELQLLYLSSTVLPRTRLSRILKIKDDKSKADKIVVSTQVVEAGVDIDMDFVIRDFAPLDCIVQSAGRCNRNAQQEKTGDVIIFKLKDETNDREYCKYIYDSILLSITENIISNFIASEWISETEMLAQVRYYFLQVSDAKAQESIADDMALLNYYNIGDFELIENYHSVQVFVELDEEAKAVRIQIEENMRYTSRYNDIQKLRLILNNNTITIKKPQEIEIAEGLPMITGTEIRYIPMNELDSWYDAETGINLKIDRSIERRII